jgi:hypothetical protein
VRTFYIDGRNTVVLAPVSNVPRPLGFGSPNVFEARREGFIPTFQKGKAHPKKFDFERANANAKSDLTKAQAKSSEPIGCKTCGGHNSLPCTAKRDDSFNSLKARNIELAEMVARMQDANEELLTRSITIAGQEARFGNRSLDNRASEETIAGPSKPKKSMVAHGPSASDESSAVKPARALRSKNAKEKEAVPEISDLDIKMGQYLNDLAILFRKIKLLPSADEGDSPEA